MTLNHLPPEVLWSVLGIFSALVASSLISTILKRTHPGKDYGELTARIRTWWVIACLFTFALLLSDAAMVVFFGFVSFLGLKEYLSLIPSRRADRRALFWAYLSIPIQYYLVYIGWYGVFIIFIPVYMFLLIATRMVLIGETEGFIRSLGTVHWGIMTTVFSLSHAAYLLVLRPVEVSNLTPSWPSEQAEVLPGLGLLVLLVMLTQLNDVAQYIWGKSFGKRRVAPKISPNKTWAGFVGGVGTTVAIAVLIGPRLTMMDWQRSVLAGLIIGLGGFFGDLSISALKRDLGVKDTGSTLPGHGGVLDRVDSLTYTAPLYFHFIYYCYF